MTALDAHYVAEQVRATLAVRYRERHPEPSPLCRLCACPKSGHRDVPNRREERCQVWNCSCHDEEVAA